MTANLDGDFPSVESLIKAGQIIKDSLSVGVSLPLIMSREGLNTTAVGTGFFYRYKEKLYLVTAGHNVTGTNPETDEVKWTPEKLEIIVCKTKNQCIAGWERKGISLREGDTPVWLEHPVHGLKVDVVAIPWMISAPDDLIKPINEERFDKDLPIQAGMDLFILGYPHGYWSDPQVAPIWKRGSLATEYSIPIGRLPRMYIDSATAQGMSGAPVVAKITGMYLPEGKENHLLNYQLNGGRSFLGVYTGRHTDQTTADIKTSIFNAQLGIVWRREVIEEIITGKA